MYPYRYIKHFAKEGKTNSWIIFCCLIAALKLMHIEKGLPNYRGKTIHVYLKIY